MAQSDTKEIYNRLNGKNMIAVASGKGGVGKTFLSITLAHAFAKKGEKVLLIDGDLGLPNIDIQLGINSSKDIKNVLDGDMPINQAVTHNESLSCDILSGRSSNEVLTGLSDGKLQLLKDDIYILAQHYDRVILDLGTGIDKSMTLLAGCTGTILIVCNEEPTSLADAYTLIKILSAQKKAHLIKIIVNMASTKKEGERTFQTLFKACQSFLNIELTLGGILHQDTHIKEAIKQQAPLLNVFPDSVIVNDIEALLTHITENT